MRAWVASGYQTLSSATKEHETQMATDLPQPPGGPSIDTLLRRYEGPAERALIRRGKALAERMATTLAHTFRAAAGLAPKLGIKNNLGLGLFSPGVIVGRGSTRAAGPFLARVRTSEGPQVSRCRHEVTVEFKPRSHGSSSVVVFTGSESSRCLSGHSAAPHATVRCEEGGLLEVESTALARTRSVRLLLSDGTSVSSGVIAIPPRLGGPTRIYFQTIRGPSPFPVSLSELDAQGRTLRVVKLRPVRNCRKMPAPVSTFREIVSAITPDGTPFTITGSSVNFTGHPEFSLSIHAGNEDGLLESVSSGSSIQVGSGVHRETILAEVGLKAGCAPHPYGIVFGRLKKSGATVLAQTASGLVPLQLARIPAALHAKGVVVYGAFSTFPSELIVRAADGRTLLRESLTSRAKEETEFCEGYAEPLSG